VSVWTLPFIVAAGALGLGFVLVFLSGGRGGRDHLAEREATKDSLVDQLRSLQADRGKLSPNVYEDRWARLLDRAAAALRDLEQEQSQPTPPDAVDPEAETSAQRPWGTMVGGIVFFVLLGVGLMEYSAPRLEGGSLTGTDLSGVEAQKAALAAAEEILKESPDDIDALNLLCHAALANGKLNEAMKCMEQARKVAPDNPEVRTHLAILQVSIGMAEKAKLELNTAIEADPVLSEALFWRGVVDLQTGNRASAVEFLERALEAAKTPSERVLASQGLREARRPPAQVMLRGQLSLGDAVTRPRGGILFVMARANDSGKGPPAAAARLDPRGVPGSFSLSDRDLMMGGAWPGQVWVQARLDADGDPNTKGEGDLVTDILGPFSPGATGVELVLSGGAASAAPAADTGTGVSGTIAVAAGKSLPEGGAVFVIVRRTQVAQGPPAAAVRLDLSSVPGAFSVGEADLMMGGAWPEEAWVQVRADADGNAMTRSESDISSPVMGPFSSGTTGVELLLGG